MGAAEGLPLSYLLCPPPTSTRPQKNGAAETRAFVSFLAFFPARCAPGTVQGPAIMTVSLREE